jgi:hypothetical protein
MTIRNSWRSCATGALGAYLLFSTAFLIPGCGPVNATCDPMHSTCGTDLDKVTCNSTDDDCTAQTLMNRLFDLSVGGAN